MPNRSFPPGVACVQGHHQGEALHEALSRVKTPWVVLQDAGVDYTGTPWPLLLAPLTADQADAVYAAGNPAWDSRALGGITRWLTRAPISNPHSGLRAFAVAPLLKLHLRSESLDGLDWEIIFKLAAQEYRLKEVPIPLEQGRTTTWAGRLSQARTLMRYATVLNDADNTHEGYNTLAQMERAPRYNAWLGRRFREHLGKRVLEVGAGIGTITRELEPGLELLIALEMDPFYIERLKNRFRDKPHVRPYLSGVERADWERLRAENIDTIVLSNVLEHIEDDEAAIQNFRRVLKPGGRLLTLIPALPALFGSMDEAVGHFRRYTPHRISHLLRAHGFEVEQLEWMNLVGVPGWFVNGRLFKRRVVPGLQLRAYDVLAPLFAELESHVTLPVGLSLFTVARAVGNGT